MGNNLTTWKTEYQKLSMPSIAQVPLIGMDVIIIYLDNE